MLLWLDQIAFCFSAGSVDARPRKHEHWVSTWLVVLFDDYIHRADGDGPLFRPVKNPITGSLHKVSPLLEFNIA